MNRYPLAPRCVHCERRPNPRPLQQDIHWIEYPAASEVAGVPVMAHLRCTSAVNFEDIDIVLAARIIARVAA